MSGSTKPKIEIIDTLSAIGSDKLGWMKVGLHRIRCKCGEIFFAYDEEEKEECPNCKDKRKEVYKRYHFIGNKL